jgi:photosystem II stability/assembly factor-like uncharacterized protein
MSEPHDPVDEWLSADVELLHPSPGTFNRIHRTARRRKTVRALNTLAGVAIVIAAAAATLPQLIGPGRGGQPNVITSRTTSPNTGTPSPRTSSPSPSPCPSPAYSASQAGAVALLGGTGQTSPAPGLRPTSVTFAGVGNNNVVGAVIGQAGTPSPSGSCTSMAGTPDYGVTWYKVKAPPAGPPNGAQGVSQLRFADPRDGWAYGPQLFATHDGGMSWQEITVHGRVTDLATINGQAFAVVAYGCQGTGQNYTANCTSFALLSSPTQSDHWRTVPGASTAIAEAPGGLQLDPANVSPQYGYLMTKGSLYAGPTAGGAWHLVSNASPSVPPCLRGGQLGPWVLAPSASGVPYIFLICGTPGTPQPRGSLTLYRSADQGVTWQRQGTITKSGTPWSLTVAPTSGSLVMATNTGIYYSTDETSWHPAQFGSAGHLSYSGPAGGFNYIGMTTTLQGVAMPANPQLGEIFTTTDGGRTWQPRRIR